MTAVRSGALPSVIILLSILTPSPAGAQLNPPVGAQLTPPAGAQVTTTSPASPVTSTTVSPTSETTGTGSRPAGIKFGDSGEPQEPAVLRAPGRRPATPGPPIWVGAVVGLAGLVGLAVAGALVLRSPAPRVRKKRPPRPPAAGPSRADGYGEPAGAGASRRSGERRRREG